MNEIIAQLQQMVGNNSALATITGGSVVIWIVSNLKNLFFVLKNMIMNLISFTIYNSYEDKRVFGYQTKDRQFIFNQLISSSRKLWERTVNLDLSNGDAIYNSRYGTNILNGCNTENYNLAYGTSIRIIHGKNSILQQTHKQYKQHNNDRNIFEGVFCK